MRTLFLCTLAILFSISISNGQTAVDRVQRPDAGSFPSASFPDYSQTTLSNGLKVFFIESHRSPTVTLQLIIKSGKTCDGKTPGTAGFTAALLNKGTTHRSAQAFAEETDFIGASISGVATEDLISINAFGLAEHFPKILELFSDAVLNPAFSKDELEKEKKKSQSILKSYKQEPDWLASSLLGKLLFGNHSYGSIVDEEAIKSIDTAALRSFHQTYFHPNNAALAVVTSLPMAAVLPALEQAFAQWKKATIPQPSLPQFPETTCISIHLIDRPTSSQSTILVGYKTFGFADTNRTEFSIVGSALGSGYTGRLPYIFRQIHGWAYETAASSAYYKDAGVFTIKTDVPKEVTAAAIEEIYKQLVRIKNEPISNEELEIQQKFLIGNYLFSLESPAKVASSALEIDFYNLPQDYYKAYVSRLSGVTPSRAESLAKAYIQTENLYVVVVGDAKSVKANLANLGKLTVYTTDLKPAP